jgi:hypothetical protein
MTWINFATPSIWLNVNLKQLNLCENAVQWKAITSLNELYFNASTFVVKYNISTFTVRWYTTAITHRLSDKLVDVSTLPWAPPHWTEPPLASRSTCTTSHNIKAISVGNFIDTIQIEYNTKLVKCHLDYICIHVITIMIIIFTLCAASLFI